jgi:hypothetical protein
MTQKTFFRFLVLIVALASLSAPFSSLSQSPPTDGYRRQTSVQLTPFGTDARVISLTRADIYLDVWGGGQLVHLPRNGPLATVRLDQDWLCSVWADVCKNRMYGPARLVLQADGYAPITGVVYWPGQQRPGDQSPATSARIEFSGGRNIGIEEGSGGNYNIAFRRAIPRAVRIVEGSGNPAAGIALEAWLYFESTNHVGVIEGESLASGKTNANGLMTIPDVDGEVAIELQREHYVLQDPDLVSPFRKIITPGSAVTTTTLVLHRFEKLPLNIHFVNPNGSAAGLTLGSCLSFCTGACCGDVATTDSKGEIRVDNYYPEEIDSLYLTDKSGTVLWKGDAPRIGDSTAIPTITISPTSR